jgi:hypothetical protein
MPIYGCPDLLDEMTPEVRARMQGKACFNFRTITREQLRELGEITKKGLDLFCKTGYA